MKTTVTLEPDVARLLSETAQRTHQTMTATINQAIRKGLMPQSSHESKIFIVNSQKMGTVKAGINDEKFNSLNDDLETEAFLSSNSIS